MNERISFDSSPSRSGIPSRNAFAAESVQPSRFHSVREASAHLDAQRAKRREEESRTIRHQRLSESPVTHAVDADFDELVGELDRLDQMSQKESMRHGVKTPSDRAYPAEALTSEVERRRADFVKKMDEVARRYKEMPKSTIVRTSRQAEETDLRLNQARNELQLGGTTSRHTRQLDAYVAARKVARERGHYPAQKPFDRFERADKEDERRLREWDARLVDNTDY